jgi:hypothetical protein
MSFILPKWEAHNVRDWKDLFVKNDEGRVELNEATAMVINYTAVIGIPEINRENTEDAWIHEFTDSRDPMTASFANTPISFRTAGHDREQYADPVQL